MRKTKRASAGKMDLITNRRRLEEGEEEGEAKGGSLGRVLTRGLKFGESGLWSRA